MVTLRFVGSRHKRAVRECHGEVEHHRLVAMLLHVVDEKVAVNVRAEFVLVGFAPGARVDVGVPVALVARRIAGLVAGPDGPVVEPVFAKRLRLEPKVVDLPLAGDRGGVVGGFHHVGEGGVVCPVKVANTPAGDVPMVHPAGAPGVLSGEQGGAGGGALRHRPGVVKLDAALGQAIDVRCVDFVRAIAGNPILAKIIDHDEQNIRLGCEDGLQAKCAENRQRKKQAFHAGRIVAPLPQAKRLAYSLSSGP